MEQKQRSADQCTEWSARVHESLETNQTQEKRSEGSRRGAELPGLARSVEGRRGEV